MAVVRRGSKRVARRTQKARVGANSLTLRLRRRGLHRFVLTAVNGKQRVTGRGTVRVTQRR